MISSFRNCKKAKVTFTFDDQVIELEDVIIVEFCQSYPESEIMDNSGWRSAVAVTGQPHISFSCEARGCTIMQVDGSVRTKLTELLASIKERAQ